MVETSGRRRHHSKRRWLLSVLAVVLKFNIESEKSLALIPLRLSVLVAPTASISRSPTEKKFCKNNNDGECDRAAGQIERSISSKSASEDTSCVDLDIEEFQQRKRKLTLQSQQQRWHQPPNPLLEDPIEFVQALLGAFQQRNRNINDSAALCLLRSSTSSWRRILLKSVGAPPDATDDEVASTLQNALERPNNQFAILTKKIEEEIKFDEEDLSSRITSIQKCWNFPSDPVIFEDEDHNGDLGGKGIITVDHCWIESRLRSPQDDQLLAVVGWSLKRRRIQKPQHGHHLNDVHIDENELSCWLLDGIDWQDFRDQFRPGIGREEWERICG